MNCDILILVMNQYYFHESNVTRIPNQKQTACDACPGNLVANSTIGICWCPFGDLVFNDQFDYCKYLQLPKI